MASTIKVNNIQNQCGANIINESANTITIGASGDTISLAAGASQTGFGRTGTVDWDTTAKTASFTAVSGTGYFVNTTSGAITVTLPAGSAGDIVGISDYASTFQTNNLTITPNGTDKINGTNENATLSTQGLAVSLVYVDDTRGWKSVTGSDNDTTGVGFISATGGTITTCGNCKIHTFTSPGTFCVSSIATCSANNEVSYLVVAGGGGGGATRGGGGGAGGFREDKSPITPYTASPLDGAGPITVTATAFPITVGAGGSSNSSGSNSVFSTKTSAGGGNGAPGFNPNCASSGGSGGGAAGPGCGASGNTPPVSPSQGNNGGNSSVSPTPFAAGGGGGATGVGTNATAPQAGPGGAGATTSISASSTTYAGGGGGSYFLSGASSGSGGSGGGGAGGTPGSPAGVAGTANTGGGGGGGWHPGSPEAGGTGGSGIVIIRYKFQ